MTVRCQYLSMLAVLRKARCLRCNSLLVNGLHKLPYHQRHTLDTLDLLLCSYQLSLQAPLLILDVLFLEVDVPGAVSHLSHHVSRHYIL